MKGEIMTDLSKAFNHSRPKYKAKPQKYKQRQKYQPKPLEENKQSTTINLIDWSYIRYMILFGAWKSYVADDLFGKYQPNPDYNPMDDANRSTFLPYLMDRFKQLMDKYDPKKSIYIIDCHRKDVWRRDIYPEYKAQRDAKVHDWDRRDAIKALDNMLEYACLNLGCKRLATPRAECDDIIFVLSGKLLAKSKYDIRIISSDHDLLQCHVHPRITQVDGCDVPVNFERYYKDGWERINNSTNINTFLLCKILQGDVSDNIPAIAPKIGMMTAIKLINNQDDLKKLMSDRKIKDAYIRNKQLIDMRNIPDDIHNAIIKPVAENPVHL
jgi:5'-3' exonuclease